MIWDQLSSKEIKGLDKRIPVLLPLTATEQHGAHLPLSTDRLIGEHFAFSLNKAIGDRLLVLPAISVGCSDHHMDFAGTLSLRHETFCRMVKEIIESVLHHGFNRFILLNSHGGNQGVMQVAFEEIGYKHPDIRLAAVTWWGLAKKALQDITETGLGGTGHACELETSILLFAAPQLVRKNEIREGGNQSTFKWAEGDMLHGPAASYYRRTNAMTYNGVFGDPTKASAEKGRSITEAVIAELQTLTLDLFNME